MSRALVLRNAIVALPIAAFILWLGRSVATTSVPADPNRVAESNFVQHDLPASTMPCSAVEPERLAPHLLHASSLQPSVSHDNRMSHPKDAAFPVRQVNLLQSADESSGLRFQYITQTPSNGTTIRWRYAPHLPLRLISEQPVTLMGTGPNGANVVVSQGNKEFASAQISQGGNWTLSINSLGTGRQEFTITTKEEDGAVFPLTLIVPEQDQVRLRQPIISHASNNSYKSPADLPGSINVYGGYLRLSGRDLDPGTRFEFAAFKQMQAGVYEFQRIISPRDRVVPSQDRLWTAELQIAVPEITASETGFLLGLAMFEGTDLHRFSSPAAGQRATFKIIAANDPLRIRASPVLKRTAEETPAGTDSPYRTNNPRIYVSGQVTPRDSPTPPDVSSEALLRDSRILVLLNGAAAQVQESADPTNGTWSATVEIPHDGRFEVTAAAVLGNVLGTASPKSQLELNRAPPRVLSANLLPEDPSRVRVVFDRPIVAPTEDPMPQIFVLREGKNSEKEPVTEPPPQFVGNAITVSYQSMIPGLYTLTVRREYIIDSFGNQMAEDYETRLYYPVDDELPAAPGVGGPTGRYVVYPEYTEPRPFVEGFNPSDHVQTRVARLYYYRDAHRVAQIINREAQSHNRAAVAMQQQRADKTRQMADQAADDRRAKERRAVEAAQRTREAERQLQEAEARSQEASMQAARAAQEQLRIEQELADPNVQNRDQLQSKVDTIRQAVNSTQAVAESERRRAADLRTRVLALRDTEAQTHEHWQAAIASEDRLREEQFRREVAAAHEDPDTYAEGHPGSIDPVRQVSVSVIGEGVVHLRGPLKGMNIIRNMINQIDAPVGQVNVGVHTVQINGERADRIEQVAASIQRYIDHSRFLTMQSAEMLRRAVVQVAAQRAMEVCTAHGMTQEERDRKYLYAFFGEDFTRELEAMDSEFLKSGNKLLSLHSMDTTSLASALFITALAKNSVRMEILQVFEQLMLVELPMAEQTYFEAGLTGSGTGHRRRKWHAEEFYLLSANARFQSLRGFFNAEIFADDTMTPVQREFVRLAQIFKSRLIVEMELRQRIMERAVIEERLSDRQKELRDALEKERDANNRLQEADAARKDAHNAVLETATEIRVRASAVQTLADNARRAAEEQERLAEQCMEAIVDDLSGKLLGLEQPQGRSLAMLSRPQLEIVIDGLEREDINGPNAAKLLKEGFDNARKDFLLSLPPTERWAQRVFTVEKRIFDVFEKSGLLLAGEPEPESLELSFSWAGHPLRILVFRDREKGTKIEIGRQALEGILIRQIATAAGIARTLGQFEYNPHHQKLLDEAEVIRGEIAKVKVTGQSDDELLANLHRSMTMFQMYRQVADRVVETAEPHVRALNLIVAAFGRAESDVSEMYKRWILVMDAIQPHLGPSLAQETRALFSEAADKFVALIQADLEYQHARRQAEAARRPLDHKKFLDMLVDEMEDKYIELLEGTRAHTANIDGYIKRLVTALDDDFNTQFYHPAFRQVRHASRAWDVTLGQVETTTILVNNRGFGKVQPQATMEFDLPKRNIVLAEAMDGAKAMIDDFGALAQDPTFLALAQLNAGQPTSSPGFGATGGLATVRNVLPSLSTETAEQVMAQHGPGRTSFGAALEGLIPDPAIYKFETGTGFEIRPVIQPDGQAVVFGFHYMYTTNVREPVRADEKHLGRVKRHFINTDVQLSNYELREVSRYTVALKASRTARGVPLLEDVPVVGVLFRPLPSAESSLQQNMILAQSTIFPTVFDLMGLRWAPVVADLDPLRLTNDEFIVRNRRRALMNRVFDHSSSEVDRFLRIPEGERRMDLYRSQESIPSVHPNGYFGPGAGLQDSHLQEGYSPELQPPSQFAPGADREGSPLLPRRAPPILESPQVPYRRIEPLETVPVPNPEHGAQNHAPPLSAPQAQIMQAQYLQVAEPAGLSLDSRTGQRQAAAATSPTMPRLPTVDSSNGWNRDQR
jgi:hypothetical protein